MYATTLIFAKGSIELSSLSRSLQNMEQRFNCEARVATRENWVAVHVEKMHARSQVEAHWNAISLAQESGFVEDPYLILDGYVGTHSKEWPEEALRRWE